MQKTNEQYEGSTVLDNEKVNVYRQRGANAHYRITLTPDYAEDGKWERHYITQEKDINFERVAMALIFDIANRTPTCQLCN